MSDSPLPFTVRVINGTITVAEIDNVQVVVGESATRVVQVGGPAGVSTFFDLSDTALDALGGPNAGDLVQFDGSNWVNILASSVGVTSHLALTDIGTNTHAAIDTHIADGSIHFADAAADDQHYARRNNAWIEFSPSSGAGLLSGVWRFSTSTTPPPASGRFQFDAGSYAATTEIDIHDFTRPGVDASNFLALLDVGDRIYLQDETNSDDWVIMDMTGPAVDNTTYWTLPVSSFQEGTFFSNNRDCLVVIQFGGGPGGISHFDLTDIGVNTHATIDTHIADGTIHFTEASIDHTAISNIGTNSHAAIDTHIADSTIHFTEGSIDHTAISNIGTNSHAAIDTHIADATIHFTEASIDHGSIAGLADDDHLQYAALAGRSGGQTLHGGTLATNQLNLRGSTNADRGIIEIRSPVEVPFDYTETPGVDIITYNPVVASSGAAVTSFILMNPDITVDSGLFIASTVRELGVYRQAVTPGFAVQTVFLGQPTLETTTAGIQPNQSFMFASQALYENVGAGAVAPHITNIIGLTHTPRLGTRIFGDTLSATNITAVNVGANYATVAGTTINFGTIRGMLLNNPTLGLFQPGGGAEGMDAYIGVEMLAIPFGGNVTKSVIRSSLVAASNARLIDNLGTAESDFGAGDIHLDDNTAIKFGNTVAAPDMFWFWNTGTSALRWSPFFGTGANPLDITASAADEWVFQGDTVGFGDIGIGFDVNAIVFGTTAPTPNSNNWFIQFAAPNQRQVQIGGEYSDVLWTAGGSIDVNGQAVSDLQAFKINSPAVVLNGGTISDMSNLYVAAMPSFGATRHQALRVLGRSRLDGLLTFNDATLATLTADVAQLTLPANNLGRYVLLIDADALGPWTIQGVLNVQVGDEFKIVNTGANAFDFGHEDAGAAAVDRIITPTAATWTLGAREFAVLWYDGAATRWRILESNGA